VKHAELYIDIGARSADEARAMGVAVGDPVGYVSELAEVGLNSGRFIGKAIDDRAGCALLLHLLEELKEQALPGDVYAIFSVQEEVGLRGARVAGQAIQADVALALDMTAADDTPDTGTKNLEIGKGPALKLMDASLLAHPAICRALTAAAERVGVPLQSEILTGIGTDAGALYQAGAGVPTGCLSVANRYTHSPVEMLDMRDLEGAYQVLREFVLQLHEIDLSFAPDSK
jgi:putative aminopeptidase FrvX